MKYLILPLLFFFSFSLLASEEFKLRAVTSEHYTLTKSGFIKSQGQFDTWNITYSDSGYSLVTNSKKIQLNVLQSDENTISLSQPVLFSGSRLFTFFRKTKKFIFQETAYSELAKTRTALGEIPEIVSISYGKYAVE